MNQFKQQAGERTRFKNGERREEMRESNQNIAGENSKSSNVGDRPLNRDAIQGSNSKFQSQTFHRPANEPKSAAALPISKPAAETPASNSKPATYNARLTLRDLKILEFILEMKFASREEIWMRFFSKIKSDQPSTSAYWAERRLLQLERAGFVKAVKSFSENTKYYLTTEKGQITLSQNHEMNKLPKHVHSIDQRCFIHDKMVLHSRIEFERAHPTGKWISERKLRAGMAAMFGLPSAMIPDGIYEVPSGERVAFELENAYKGPKAYGEKITFFVKLMRMKKDDPQMFSKVKFRCVRQEVFSKLKEMTAMYGDMFEVEMWEPNFKIDPKALQS